MQLTGDGVANTLTGGFGYDTLLGNGGDDNLYGIEGKDTLDGGEGADYLSGGPGDDTLRGGEGNDTLEGGLNSDLMIGGGGDDLYILDSALDRVEENTGGGRDTVVSILIDTTLGANVEDLIMQGGWARTGTGNGSDNLIQGTDGNNILNGLAGHDTLYGLGGIDALYGSDGVDMLFGGAGADHLDGGDGFDYARYDYAPEGVTARLAGDGPNAGEAAGDTYAGIEGLIGSSSSDVLIGDGGVNELRGNGGNDALVGGGGVDVLSGGADADSFFFYGAFGHDIVADFEPGQDKLHFLGVGGIASMADVWARSSEVGADTLIQIDAERSVTLRNFQMAQFASADVVIG